MHGAKRPALILAPLAIVLVLVVAGPACGSQHGGIQGIFRNLALDAASSRLNLFMEQNQPVVRDWDTVFPHTDELPGPPFQPVGVPENVWSSSLAASGYQTISLPPGDYSIPVQLYCMHFAGGSGPGFTYLLGPFRGTRAKMISTLIGRASIDHSPHMAVQVLAWDLQVGDSYQQLDPGSRALFDQLLPEYKHELGPGFLESVGQFWDTLAQNIPGLPSFETAINRLGPASALLSTYRRAQFTVAQNAANYQQLSQHLLFTQLGGQGMATQVKPWSIVAPGIYERLITDSTAMGQGTFEIRVLPSALSVQSDPNGPTVPISSQGSNDPTTVAAPIDNVVGYPVNCNDCQIPMSEILPTTTSSAPTEASKTQGSGPKITSVSPMPDEPNPVLVIKGNGFGDFLGTIPQKGDSPGLRMIDKSRDWEAGYQAPRSVLGDICDVTLSMWSDTTIIAAANVGAHKLGPFGCRIAAGDQIEVDVWNPQTNGEATAVTSVQTLTTTPPDSGYKVAGNVIKGPGDSAFLARGVAYSGLEVSQDGYNPNNKAPAGYYPCGEKVPWNPITGPGCIARSIRSWDANTIRLALNQDFWLSDACDSERSAGVGYRQLVDEFVTSAEAESMIVILDLHWSDQGSALATITGCPTAMGQQRMADANSLAFWYEVARKYRRDPDVWFELYNEPHTIKPTVWRNGGVTLEGWYAAGMQQLYEVVREAGASNIVIAGGQSYANTLAFIVPKWALDGYNIAYAAHTYANGCSDPIQPSDLLLQTLFGFASRWYPVIVTEFGQCDGGSRYVSQFIRYANRKGSVKPASRLGWTAWAWNPTSPTYPSLLSSWNGAASTEGQPVECALYGNTAPGCEGSLGRGTILSSASTSSPPSHAITQGGIPVNVAAVRAAITPGEVALSVSPVAVVSGAQFTCSGTVKSTNGKPIAGVTLQISASVGGSTLPLTTATTGNDGAFSAVLNAPPITGSLVITATVPGASPPVQGSATLTVTAAQ